MIALAFILGLLIGGILATVLADALGWLGQIGGGD
jgi:hypothetical protein